MMIAALGKEHTLITGVHERRPVETPKGTLAINSTYTVATKQTTWTGRVRYTALYHVTRGASKKNHHDALEAYNKTVEAQDKEDRLREEQERKDEAARKKAEQQLKREQEAAARREEALKKSAQAEEKEEILHRKKQQPPLHQQKGEYIPRNQRRLQPRERHPLRRRPLEML